jgi:hypothetical protein
LLGSDDGDAGISADRQQVAIAGDEILGISGNRAGDNLIVVWVAGNRAGRGRRIVNDGSETQKIGSILCHLPEGIGVTSEQARTIREYFHRLIDDRYREIKLDSTRYHTPEKLVRNSARVVVAEKGTDKQIGIENRANHAGVGFAERGERFLPLHPPSVRLL